MQDGSPTLSAATRVAAASARCARVCLRTSDSFYEHGGDAFSPPMADEWSEKESQLSRRREGMTSLQRYLSETMEAFQQALRLA